MMQRALAAAGVREVPSPLNKPAIRLMARAVRKSGSLRWLRLPSREAVFCQLIGPNGLELFPFSIRHKCITYSFDCWETHYPFWEKLFRTNRLAHVFLSAKQSVEEMRKRVPDVSFEWLPEAIDPEEFFGEKRLADRSIDVLELGRRSAPYHEAIRDRLRSEKRKHVFDPGTDAPLFLAQRSTVLSNYADCKVSICFPRSMTQPGQASRTETVTARYFEAMASKALVVGHCPAELEELFGYNPVVQVNWSNPFRQLSEGILSQISAYQELVESNYKRLLEVGTFTQRAKRIVEVLTSIESRLS